MTDYEYLNWIMSHDFSCKGKIMKEEKTAKGKKSQRVTVIPGRGVSGFEIYEFGSEENCRHLPFFNHMNNHPTLPNAPSELLAFCDYIILAECKRKAYVLLIEMKRGVRSHGKVQLEASRTFMNYVLASAERIKKANSMDDFNSSDVEFRRIILTESKKELLSSHMPKNIDVNDIFEYSTIDKFDIREAIG